ncbi:hypothetical protein J6590_089680 [Homalodisca vitripennis]|nr:hypothetical protein J6590_089680 [Homalodisca vitripennis]
MVPTIFRVYSRLSIVDGGSVTSTSMEMEMDVQGRRLRDSTTDKEGPVRIGSPVCGT